MSEEVIERELGWEDEIEQESEFILFPAGNYTFKVESFERQRFEGSEKMPACPVAVLKLTIINNETGEQTKLEHRLLLHSKTEWKISEFFTSIGLKQKGEKLKMNWQAVPGSYGTCKLGTREYNGNTYNEVKKFLSPEDDKSAAAPTTSW